MATSSNDLEKLALIIKNRKIVTMEELKTEFETLSNRTLYRKLKLISYRTSYSHGSGYFSLSEIIEFNKDGLWCHNDVWFSKYGTLLATLEAWINQSKNGFFANELQEALHVSVKESLLKLVNTGRITREKVSGLYLYCAKKSSYRKKQLSFRRAVIAAEQTTDKIKAAIILFFSLIDEQQRRLFAGLESIRYGPGGDKLVSDLLGINIHTVAKGRKQLLEHDIEIDRIRACGGGRKSKKKF